MTMAESGARCSRLLRIQMDIAGGGATRVDRMGSKPLSPVEGPYRREPPSETARAQEIRFAGRLRQSYVAWSEAHPALAGEMRKALPSFFAWLDGG
jgi:hypothetical protein